MQIAILAHEQFPERAKTAIGVMRYGPQDVVAVLDRENAGTRVQDHTNLVSDVPIVASMEDVGAVDALVIGIAPIGGAFDDSWRADVENALSRGCDVISGLHTFLADDPAFAELAEETGAIINDVRRPPDDLTVAEGIAGDVDAKVILTVGTDASVGKMTTSYELVEAITDAGHSAAVIPTGQTGIMIENWGYPIDRTIADFMAGAVEELVVERGDSYDYLIVEGQGSIVHPAYSGVTTALLHGSMPDSLVMVHDPTRTHNHGYPNFPIPPIDEYTAIYEAMSAPVSGATVDAVALNTRDVDDQTDAHGCVREVEAALNVPATDIIRFSADPILEAVL